MLFSSSTFVFAFLPLVIGAIFLAGRLLGRSGAFAVLVIASLVFYGWWKWEYLFLLALSVTVNYGFGLLLTQRRSRFLLAIGVSFNLGLLGWFKYAGFLAEALNALLMAGFSPGPIVLPLAISFYTFQQIAYLADVQAGKVSNTSFLHYCLFVTFFPQLIAGPIVHHAEIIPQFKHKDAFRLGRRDLTIGLAIFILGLYKKVVFADGIALHADSLFNHAQEVPTFIDAWGGVLAYSFQIYFDFSAYSDMAIGLARIFGIRLPLNFHSPYKAVSIIDFWRRWHMTLSRFLRDYLYFPLGGNRRGPWWRYRNLAMVMLLGGLWHGAGWTFMFWGGLHGTYLIINHAWRGVRKNQWGHDLESSSRLGRTASRFITFLAVAVAWVFFRAESWGDAFAILEGLIGLNGLSNEALGGGLLDPMIYAGLLFFCVLVWFAPNTQQLLARHDPALDCDELRLNIDTATHGFATERLVLMVGDTGIAGRSWSKALLIWTAAVALLIVAVRGAEQAPFIYMFF
jgi:alginate O-acetyltransferase complex protein AlgI